MLDCHVPEGADCSGDRSPEHTKGAVMGPPASANEDLARFGPEPDLTVTRAHGLITALR